MSLKAGIVGLPNVGKSTLFNAITNSNVEAANYPFATINPNVGIVKLKDERLLNLAKLVDPEKIIYSTFEFIDIAGLVEGASKGEGLGNKFLANIKDVDAIIHVVRCFENSDVTHVFNNIDPIRDLEIINLELIFADIQILEKALLKIRKKAKNTTDKAIIQQHSLFKKALEILGNEKSLRDADLNDDEKKSLKSFNLLTIKPMIYIGNIEEEFIAEPTKSTNYKILKNYGADNKIAVVPISSKIEFEISELDEEDQELFLDDLGIKESGLNTLIKQSFKLLNLSTFFTVGKIEVRSWTYITGSEAPDCAAVIHTDFKKGFIKVDVIKYDDFIELKGEVAVKESGKMKIEGKNYIVQDGDICHFKFNV